MRISTSMIYDRGISSIQNQNGDLLKLQQQIATGRRILTPADDSLAATRVLEVGQSKSANEQFMRNADYATSALEIQDATLGQLTELLQNIRTLAVSGGDASLTPADRNSLITELESDYQHLLGLANATDGSGQYLFSGYQGDTLPFAQIASNIVSYRGDQGQRLIQVGPSRQIPVSTSGADVFQRVRNGNGTFVTNAGASNMGTGIISPGVVLDPAKWGAVALPAGYDIVFAVDNGTVPSVVTYDIVDNTSGNSMVTGAASTTTADPLTGGPRFQRTFVSGQAISFKQLPTDPPAPAWDFGIEADITGIPASTQGVGAYVPGSSDTFTIKPSRTDQDLFSTVSSLIATLKSPITTAYGNTRIINGLNTALSDLDLAMENVLSVRATVGASLKEVEAHKNTGEDVNLQHETTLSNLQDLDYAKAISEMSLKQMNLQAAQKTFLNIQELTLFNYL